MYVQISWRIIMIQLKNNGSDAITVNWSNGEQTILAAAGLGNVPVGILESEVDLKLGGLDYIQKLCGSNLSSADADVMYKVFEGNDAQFTISPVTVTVDLVEGETEHLREVEISVTTAAGERVSFFDADVTLTLTTNSADGDVLFVQSEDLVAGVTSKTASLRLSDGLGVVSVSCVGDWLDGETNTLTVTGITYKGISVSSVTSVETINIEA